MSSEVEIANLALSHLGDTATVASLNPPEGSAQAEHCARFYPMARDALLELHHWNFATSRVNLAQVTSTTNQWKYAYARPNNCLKVLAILDPNSTDDLVTPFYTSSTWLPPVTGMNAAQPYVCEVDGAGNPVILTNQAGAMCRYTMKVTDSAAFSPLFVTTLSWHLAAMLAGPVIKGDAGAAEAKRCLQMAGVWLAKATASDAQQRSLDVLHSPAWIGAR